MEINNKLIIWTVFLIISSIDLNNGQILAENKDFCFGPKEMELLKEELKALKKHVGYQESRIGNLERELDSVKQSLSNGGDMTFPISTMTSSLTSTTTVSSLTTQATRLMGNKGREFLILFMRNIPVETLNSVTIYITTEHNTTVNISTSAHLNSSIKAATDRIMNVSSFSKIMLSEYLTCDYLKIEPKAVLIQTSELSTVSIFDNSYETYSNDGAMIIPTNRLSVKYLVSSTNPHNIGSYFYSQFAIAALYEVTRVNIRFKIRNNTSLSVLGGTYRDNDLFTTILNKYETLQLMHTTDLTGTFIVSTKPISVFSGNRCQILKNGCSHMMTQLPPTTEFDVRYIVPPFYGEWGTLIQVISESQNSINISVGSRASMWHMEEKEFKNTEVTTNETTIIESSNPVLVTGFGMGSANNDPYMTVMPGVHQYIDNYKIVIPDGYRDNFICVIIPEKSKNYLQINGYSIENYNTVRLSSAVLDTIYSIYTFKVNSGTKVLSTTNNAAFGLIAYSHRQSDGYAFAGSYVLS